MNSLSWLIYAADTITRIGPLMFVAGILFCAVGLATMIPGKFVLWERYGSGDDAWAEQMAVRSMLGRTGVRLCVIGPLLIVLSMFVPSSRTLYLIAASEAGEAVVTNPDTIEMMGDLKAIIKKRLKDELGE